jgi:hypothetical protein
MSAPVSSIHHGTPSAHHATAAHHSAAGEPGAVQSFGRILDMLSSGKRLRLIAVAGLVFLAWKAFQGLKSLFWVAFGLAWVVFWTQGGGF